MTFASLRNTTAFIVALIGAALLGGAAPASGASITYSDPACASFTVTESGGNLSVVCAGSGGGATGKPTGCSITPSPTSLPVGGGLVNLTASCSGGDPVVNYHWTASPSATGLTADTSATTNSATIAATTAFTVVASNANGTGQATTSVQVGGVAGGISCASQGFAKTLSYTWNWANGGMTINTYNDAQGPMGSNGIIVVAFTPMVSVLSSAGTVAIAPYPPPAESTTRTTTISTTPCTLAGSGPWAHIGGDAGTAFTVGVFNTRIYPALVAGQTYYLNIANRNSAGGATCSGSACDVRVQLSRPTLQ